MSRSFLIDTVRGGASSGAAGIYWVKPGVTTKHPVR